MWVVAEGSGAVTASDGRGAVTVELEAPGAYPLFEHGAHTAGELAVDVAPGVRVLATCFTPGVISD